MGKIAQSFAAVATLALLALGCGVADDYDAGNELRILSINGSAEGGGWEFSLADEVPVTAVIELANEPRLGVGAGVPLRVFRVDVTYPSLDPAAAAPFASQQSVALTIESGGTGDLEGIVVIPGLLRLWLLDQFTNGSYEDWLALEFVDVAVDVYARDDANGDTVSAHGAVTVHFYATTAE